MLMLFSQTLWRLAAPLPPVLFRQVLLRRMQGEMERDAYSPKVISAKSFTCRGRPLRDSTAGSALQHRKGGREGLMSWRSVLARYMVHQCSFC